MPVNQIGTITSFTAGTIIVSADVNTINTTFKDAFNSLVTAQNELAGGLSVGGSLTIASGGFTVTAGGIVLTAGVLSVDDATDTSSGVTGSIHTDGGLGVAKALWVATTSRLVGTVTAGAIVTVGDLSLDGDLSFVGAQAITTTAGDLTFNPADDVACGSNNFTGMGTLGCGAITTVGDLSLDGDLDFVGAQAITTSADNLSLTPSGDLILNNGQNFIGDTANANMAVGLTINQAANSDQILAFKSSSVSHGMTTIIAPNVEDDDFFTVARAPTGTGGIILSALQPDAANATTMILKAYGGTATTTKSFAGRALVEIEVAEHNGSNSLADITANGNVFAVRGQRTGFKTLFIVDEDGDTWQDGNITVDGGSITGDGTSLTVTDNLIVSGTGPHAIGGATTNQLRLYLTGAYLSGGSSNFAAAFYIDGTLTGANADTNFLSGTVFANVIATQTASESIALVSQLRVSDPLITDNLTGGGVITNATVLYLDAAPSEGATNTILLTAQGAYLHTDGTWTDGPSYRALKDNITPLGGLRLRALIDDLEPVTFSYRDGGTLGLHVVVEDYGATMTRHGILDHNSGSDGIAPTHLATVALAGVKDLQARVRALEQVA